MISLPLQRDHEYLPYMRIATNQSQCEAWKFIKSQTKLKYKNVKECITKFHIISREFWKGYPITRIALQPITGRRHQLRVHCAAIGHPILGDPAYGFNGFANSNGGLYEGFFKRKNDSILLPFISYKLQCCLYRYIKEYNYTMCLQATNLSFDHPITRENSSWDYPSWF